MSDALKSRFPAAGGHLLISLALAAAAAWLVFGLSGWISTAWR